MSEEKYRVIYHHNSMYGKNHKQVQLIFLDYARKMIGKPIEITFVDYYMKKRITDLKSRLKIATEALEFYGNEDSFYTQWHLDNPKWKDSGGEWSEDVLILKDMGDLAREALKKIKGEK